MRRSFFNSLLQLVLVLFGVLTILFFVLRLSGDPVLLLAGPDAPPEAREALRHQMGLDQPLIVQYGNFLKDTMRLDFGKSLRSQQSALALAADRLPATIQLSLASLALTVLIGIPIGLATAVRRRAVTSQFLMGGTLLLQAMPSFWLGLLLILLFAVRLQWLPSFGGGTPLHLIMPALTLSGLYIAKTARLVRSGMLEVLTKDYVRTAAAKGVPPASLLFKHVFRNGLVSVLTVLLLDVGQLLGGAVVTETVFAWPGVGTQLTTAVLQRDYPVVQASVFLISVMVVVLSFLGDLCYRLLDPRLET